MLLLLRLLAFQHSQLWAEGVLVRILVLGGLDPRTGLRALATRFSSPCFFISSWLCGSGFEINLLFRACGGFRAVVLTCKGCYGELLLSLFLTIIIIDSLTVRQLRLF